MPYSFVKDEGESDEAYLAEVPAHWEAVIRDTHAQLLAVAPGYQIGQIKSKFGGLRYYFDSTFPFESPEYARMDAIVTEAERRVAEIQKAGR